MKNPAEKLEVIEIEPSKKSLAELLERVNPEGGPELPDNGSVTHNDPAGPRLLLATIPAAEIKVLRIILETLTSKLDDTRDLTESEAALYEAADKILLGATFCEEEA